VAWPGLFSLQPARAAAASKAVEMAMVNCFMF
jgi:hypothetical protein